LRFEGIGASSGAAVGKAVVFLHQAAMGDPGTVGTFRGVEEETAVFLEARKKVYEELLTLAREAEKKFTGDEAGIFEGYAEILIDDEIEKSACQFIQRGLNAAAASQKVMDGLAEEWKAMEGGYMAERASDIRDLGKKLTAVIKGGEGSAVPLLTEAAILIADELSPFELAAVDHQFLKALALDTGGYAGHAAILARSLGIPCVTGLGRASRSAANGEHCALDGDAGLLVLNPDENEAAVFAAIEKPAGEAPLPIREKAYTRDGSAVTVCANIGSVEEARHAVERGADGVGLLRTEFLYINMNTLPGEEEQYETYAKILEALKPRPLTIRTMDIGGDKEFPALGLEKEENPFLGYRAIRISLDQKAVFKTQLRAILRAAASGNTELMFPMIISPAELKAAKTLVDECRAELEHEGLPIGKPPVGIMIETPAAALMARELAEDADFFSLGTNDLTQYTLAADRGNPKVASLFDPLHPAVLRLMSLSAEAAIAAGIPISICGELAGDVEVLPLLIGLGISKLSLAAPKIPLIKERIKKLDIQSCRALAQKVLSCHTAEEVHELLGTYSLSSRSRQR
jgi:phosphotransferase system enzyme I (PtsI)